MEYITYSLRDNKSSSDGYYSAARAFTEKLIEQGKPLMPLVDEFMNFNKENDIEEVRDKEEYLFELLSFGVLWQTYAHVALEVKIAPFKILANLAEWRKKHQKIKPYIDTTRGILTTLFLLPGKTKIKAPAPPPTIDQLEHVYKWFMATGEFREQALRFINWRQFWQTKSVQEIESIFKEIESLGLWFSANAKNELGGYTAHVNQFLNKSKETYRWREDRISCTRGEVEYHLNMVGAEIMNRAFRKDFENTSKKAVLVPGCMRSLNASHCKATKVPGGLKCRKCTPDCRVNQLVKLGKENEFEVYIIPHASDLSLWSPAKRNDNLGVVASACLTTLVEGGWELKRYGVPAQCVVLDYCGCKKHWHSEGIVTEFNNDELMRILKG